MTLSLIRESRPYEFRWWSGDVEPYVVCLRYRVDDPSPGLVGGELSVAVGWRAAFGANRRRILVCRNPLTVLIDLVGTDDWEETSNTVWLLKLPRGSS